jgi:PQQ-dependent dehydrogenase (methanol/ethanol family)
MRFRSLLCIITVLLAPACSEEPLPSDATRSTATPERSLRPIDDARLLAAGDEPESWLTHGGTYSEQRFSRLSSIDAHNVADLGLAWSFDLDTQRAVEATPLVADGVMYVSAPWSLVHALDAATGEHLWTYDPEVPRNHARELCCGPVNRGVALYGEKVFVGTLDGRLVAIDRRSGERVWQTQTAEGERPYSITGAPRVVKGRVIIGNGGADMGVRGYVSAYDAETGALAWRTYTVPGDPSMGFESEAMEKAAETWSGDWWVVGGGGTVWDGMAFDPELDLLYVGTGNGTPHVRWLRDPAEGDNLYLSSILALDPDNGEIVWHYQETPRDNWDYTATAPLMLADLEIGGELRKTILHAPKNGFFFVIDRTDGSFLSAQPYSSPTWALGYDEKGRPIENEALDYREAPKFARPSFYGAHSWQPWSRNPETGLVYFSERDIGVVFAAEPDYAYDPMRTNSGTDAIAISNPDRLTDGKPNSASLVAWDPVKGRAAWRVPQVVAVNGGTLSTAGGLVFQGSADGRFSAYRASDGERLWESNLATGVVAGPTTYEIDGEQYVAVTAGWAASFVPMRADAVEGTAERISVRGRELVAGFKLGASAPMPPGNPRLGPVPEPTFVLETSGEEVARGEALYHDYCVACHGVVAVSTSGSSMPDLRYLSEENHHRFDAIVRGGLRLPDGMPTFADLLSTEDARAIQNYVLTRARESAER